MTRLFAALVALSLAAPAAMADGVLGSSWTGATFDRQTSGADRVGEGVTPTEHGRAMRYDAGAHGVRIQSLASFDLNGKTVRTVGDGMLYRVEGDAVIIQHETQRGTKYFLSYAPVQAGSDITGTGRRLRMGDPLGTCKSGQLLVKAWAYGAQGGFVYKPFNLPGVRFPAGTPDGQGSGDF